jgi:hypothetical protein
LSVKKVNSDVWPSSIQEAVPPFAAEERLDDVDDALLLRLTEDEEDEFSEAVLDEAPIGDLHSFPFKKKVVGVPPGLLTIKSKP